MGGGYAAGGHITGTIRHGEDFEGSIGTGLSLRVEPDGEDDWEIEVGPEGTREDYSRCSTGPCHGPNAKDLMAWHFHENSQGPGGVGEKRHIDFTLNSADNAAECHETDLQCQGKDTYDESRTSGRCYLRPLSVILSGGPPEEEVIESLTLEADCAMHGALELWKLPALYVIPDDFTGWLSV